MLNLTLAELEIFNETEPEMTINKYGCKEYRLNGKLHRIDGPALDHPNGHKEWHQNGKLHRVDGPAAEYHDGSKEWYQNGKLHRYGGPAVIRADGSKLYYEKGVRTDIKRRPKPELTWV